MERAKKLHQSQFISAQEWDAARTAYEMALANHRKAKEYYALVVEGPRKEEIETARAQLNQAQASLRLAKTRKIQVDALRRELETAKAQVKEAASALEVIQTQIEYSKLHAPVSGVVLVKNTEIGEYLVPGGAAVTLGDLDKTWLKAFITETDLGGGCVRYEIFEQTPHHHLICQGCGEIKALDDSLVAQLRQTIEEEHHYMTDIDHMAIFGWCGKCRPQR